MKLVPTLLFAFLFGFGLVVAKKTDVVAATPEKEMVQVPAGDTNNYHLRGEVEDEVNDGSHFLNHFPDRRLCSTIFCNNGCGPNRYKMRGCSEEGSGWHCNKRREPQGLWLCVNWGGECAWDGGGYDCNDCNDNTDYYCCTGCSSS